MITEELARQLVNLHPNYSHDFSYCWPPRAFPSDFPKEFSIDEKQVTPKHSHGTIKYHHRLFDDNNDISLEYINGKLCSTWYDMRIYDGSGKEINIFVDVTIENPVLPKIIQDIRKLIHGKNCLTRLIISHTFDIHGMEKL